jgi:hypothetical protein
MGFSAAGVACARARDVDATKVRASVQNFPMRRIGLLTAFGSWFKKVAEERPPGMAAFTEG